MRLTLRTADIGLTGVEAAERFRSMGVEPEYADGAFVVLLPTPMNGEEDFARLEGALRALPRGKGIRARGICVPPPVPVLTPQTGAFRFFGASAVGAGGRSRRRRNGLPLPAGRACGHAGRKITREAAEFYPGMAFAGFLW